MDKRYIQKRNVKNVNLDNINNELVWTTEKVNECIEQINKYDRYDGELPFYENSLKYRASNILFKYTDEELEIIKRCSQDIVFFANNFCKYTMDDGIGQITLRPYQEKILNNFKNNRFNVVLAARQSGKTVTSVIFIAWYLLFNIDKTVLMLANKFITSKDNLNKLKIILEELPFFLKPGILVNNVMEMRFDNGCRVLAMTTTKNTAIGFTIHLAYLDEFAHIEQSMVEAFYKSVYPTLSSSKISRIIISSTPNGKNKFWEIYKGAVEHTNEYVPNKIDWWEVPGRDEEWKKKEIANLGSEELFNQEYGNQFLLMNKPLFSYSLLNYIERIKETYIFKELIPFENACIDYSELKFKKSFDIYNIDMENDHFLFCVDIADGVGQDYSIINIFKIEPMSITKIKKVSDISIKNESSFFRINQVGLFRSNTKNIEEFSKILEILSFEVFNPYNIQILLEINFKGEFIINKISNNINYYDDIIFHTHHSETRKNKSQGIKITSKNKILYCQQLNHFLNKKIIILNEEETFTEMCNFVIDNNTYHAQFGHDDIISSSILLSSFLYSEEFENIIYDMYDKLDEKYKKEINQKLYNVNISVNTKEKEKQKYEIYEILKNINDETLINEFKQKFGYDENDLDITDLNFYL